MLESVLFLICFFGVPVLMFGALLVFAFRHLRDRRQLRLAMVQLGAREVADAPIRERLRSLGFSVGATVSLPVRLEIETSVGPVWVVHYRLRARGSANTNKHGVNRRILLFERGGSTAAFMIQKRVGGMLESLADKALGKRIMESPMGWKWARISAEHGEVAMEDLQQARGAAFDAALKPAEALRLGGGWVALSAPGGPLAKFLESVPTRAATLAEALETSAAPRRSSES